MTDAETRDMDPGLCEIIRRHSVPMKVRPTGIAPVLGRLPNIRAVLFDVYGTLFISGSGDVGTTDVGSKPLAFPEALASVGLEYSGNGEEGVQLLTDTIVTHHQRDRDRGIEHPEVDIRDVWTDVIQQLETQGNLVADDEISLPVDTTIPALEYEARTNPTWPMPNALACLHQLQAAGVPMGLVSNAQCFTRLLFSTQLGESLRQLGIREDWCFWSYEHRQAKPGTFLFEFAREATGGEGIAAHEVLYVGNDLLKDVWPAKRVGFRTALFAGDARSYRPRDDDARAATVSPDLVLTDLGQLPACVAGRVEG